MDALAGVLVFLCIYNLNRQAGLLEPACEYLTRALIGQVREITMYLIQARALMMAVDQAQVRIRPLGCT